MASSVAPDHDIDKSTDDSDNECQNGRESRKKMTEYHYDSQESSKRTKLVDDRFQNNDENEGCSKKEKYHPKGGLANSLHGNIYQLKLQMLFLKRALDKKYDFQLGTEVEDAHKFDDVVFKYKRENVTGNYEIRFVQAKHKQCESKKITASDLLTDTDDDYSLQKYFISYSKIKQVPEFNKSIIKDFIMYTNIDFDYSNLRDRSIDTISITENDPILKVTNSSKTAKRVKLSVPKEHELYEKLRETTDLHVLASALKEHIVNKSKIKMSGIFKHYQYVLSKTVLNINTACATFRDEFLNGVNLSEDVEIFRNILQSALKIENSDQFKETLSQAELPVSEEFASKTAKLVKLNVPEEHILYEKLRETTDLRDLASALKEHIVNKSKIKMSGIFKHYQYVLSKTVLNINTACATFRDEFLNGVNLSEDVEIFRNILQSALKIENSDQFKETLSQAELPVSEGFAEVIDFHPNPIVDDPECLAETFAQIVIKVQKERNNVITISRKLKLINSNINKLAFHILVQDEPDNGLVKFAKQFFESTKNLKGNLDNFRSYLKAAFENHGVDFSTLRQYKFKISKFCTCEETSEGDLIYIKSEFPNNTVKDTDIEDFLVKLVFAINQPNELELGEIIAEEMGQSCQFNLLDADLVSNSFQNKMLDWFKQKRPEKGREGVWLDAESGKEFLNSIEEKVSVLISSGINLAYPEKLATFDIRFRENKIFEKVKNFLSKENVLEKMLCIITPEKETLLSAINVYSSLENLKQQEEYAQYQKNDSCIFMRLKTLLSVKIQSYIIQSFKSLGSYNLLIVDCKCMASHDIRKLCSKLSDILIDDETNKKIVLIANKQNDIIENFDEDLQSYITTATDDATFFDLTDESKSMLLQKQVIFQGRKKKVCLYELINQSDEKARDVINVGIMVKLLKDKEISIGNVLKDLSEISDYYIHRKFKPVVFSKADIQKYLEESAPNSDVFVVTGADSGLQHVNIHAFDNVQSAEKFFNELLSKYSKLNIHWLESESDQFIWRKSHGSILNLMPYRIQKNDIEIEESRLIDEEIIRDKITIISGTAGMGKSTVLTNLSMELINDPSLWIVRINLNNHSEKLEIKSKGLFKSLGESVDEVTDFLFNDLLVLQDCDKFDKNLFIHNLKNHGKIAFLFDGFDEICPDDADVVIDLLRSLRKLNARNIIVTTRTNFRHKLENELGVFGSILEPFSKGDQIEFLIKFWKKKLESTNLNTNKIDIYAKSILKHLCEYINDNEKEFVSNPLHLMMVAEVFQGNVKATDDVNISKWQGCKEFLESDLNSPIFSTKLSLVKLYEHFIERKYFDFYLKGKGITDISKTSVRKGKDDSNEAYATFKTKNGLLALKLFFNEKELKELLSASDITKLENVIKKFNDGEHIKGIVNEIIKGKPHFIHRTFAEYFASTLIAEKILTAPSDTLQCINNVMLNMSPIFMHCIIDKLKGKHETLKLALDKPLLHFILTDSCSNFLKLLIQSNCSDWQKKLDDSGKTPLHHAVILGNSYIVWKVLKYADDIRTDDILKNGNFKFTEYEKSVLVEFINVKDNYDKTALYYAVQKKLFYVAFELLLKGACINLLTDDNVNALIRHMYSMAFVNNKYHLYMDRQDTKYFLSFFLKYHPIREKLVLAAPGFFNNVIESDQPEILSYFFRHGRVQVIETLLATIDNIQARNEILKRSDWCSKNSLENVLRSNDLSDESRLEITKKLYEYSDCFSLFSMEPPPMEQVIINAAVKGHVQTLKFFINLQNQPDYYNIVYSACKNGQIRSVKYMYENYKALIIDSNGNTGLHAACSIGNNITIPKKLPFYGFVKKMELSYGFRLDIIKYLIDNVDINVTNKYGQTPLDLAKSLAEQQNVIEYLISKGATTNSAAKCGNTAPPLDIAGESGDEDNRSKCSRTTQRAEQQCQSKKQRQSAESFGYPRLHFAILAKDFDSAKKIIRDGVDVDEKDANGDAPLHLCITKYFVDVLSVVLTLLLHGAIFDIKNKSHRTPCDLIPDELKTSTVAWVLSNLTYLFSSENLDEALDVALREISIFDDVVDDRLVSSSNVNIEHIVYCMLHSRNNQQKTLLHIAADTNDEEFLNNLLLYNRYTVFNDHTENIKHLPDLCYQPSLLARTDSEGNTPVHLASRNGYRTIVFKLLNVGAKFNSINDNGDTPEKVAVRNNHKDVVEVLQAVKQLFVSLEEGTNYKDIEQYIKAIINAKSNYVFNAKSQTGKSALHLAATLNQQEQQVIFVKLLLDNGGDITSTDDKGNTLLHIAAINDNIKNVKLLLDYGALYDATNIDNDKPLKLARGESYDLLVLIETSFKDIKGDEPQKAVANLETYDKDVITAIVHSRDYKGNTLLHYAAYLGDSMMVECLLGNGAMYNAENFRDTCPLTTDHNSAALLKTIEGMFQNLNNIYEGANNVKVKVIQNVLDCKRKSLLDYAKERGESKIISFLNEITADE